MAAATHSQPLTEHELNLLRRYTRGEDVATIADHLKLTRQAVGDTLIRLCNLNRNAARELVRFAPAAPAAPLAVHRPHRKPAPPRPAAVMPVQDKSLRDAAKRAAECPNAAAHTPHPAGHVQHSDWADQMMATHEQQQCPGCGLWAIWVPIERVEDHALEPAAVAPTEPAEVLEPQPDAPTPVASTSVLPPGTELVVAYPVLVCRSCGFAEAVPQHHIGCSAKAVRGYCLIVAEEASC